MSFKLLWKKYGWEGGEINESENRFLACHLNKAARQNMAEIPKVGEKHSCWDES